MNKLQVRKLIYRDLLHFYTLTAKYQKEKLRKQSHLPCIKKENKAKKKTRRILPKEAQNLYFKNYKKLMIEIENDTNIGLEELLLLNDHTTQGNL